MLNNPYNMSPDQFLAFAESFPEIVRPNNETYVIFASPETQRSSLYHVLCRILWDRNGVPQLMRDHSWHHTMSPERIR